LASTVNSTPDTPLLRVAGLRTVFRLADGRNAAAVDDVTFSIAPGETLGLVGESGCGKSVTALSIIRLVMPPGRIAGGRVELEGQNLFELDEEAMRRVRGRRIGFIFQEPMVALNPVFTVGAQIEETLQAHGLARGAAARRRAVELLSAVRVPDPDRRAREYPHQLSGGLRQRAMIALALAAEPQLVIADEPTTALDVTVQAEILDLLRDMRRQFRLSLLLITHDLGVIAEMADRVAVMYGGRLVEQAPVKSLFTSPAHPYTRGLLASIPGGARGDRLKAIPGTVPALGGLGAGCAFAPRCADRMAVCATHPPDVTGLSASHDVRCYLYAGSKDPASMTQAASARDGGRVEPSSGGRVFRPGNEDP
jgi:oligopeptide/dipeptide ABC transporter ATP-binding protein